MARRGAAGRPHALGDVTPKAREGRRFLRLHLERRRELGRGIARSCPARSMRVPAPTRPDGLECGVKGAALA